MTVDCLSDKAYFEKDTSFPKLNNHNYVFMTNKKIGTIQKFISNVRLQSY